MRRDQDPHRGEWSFPSGFVDAGEELEQAAVREAKEETGLDLRILRLVGAYSFPGDPVVFIAYAARVTGGRIAIGAECQDVRYFPLDALPPLAFAHDPAILQAWRDSRTVDAPARQCAIDHAASSLQRAILVTRS